MLKDMYLGFDLYSIPMIDETNEQQTMRQVFGDGVSLLVTHSKAIFEASGAHVAVKTAQIRVPEELLNSTVAAYVARIVRDGIQCALVDPDGGSKELQAIGDILQLIILSTEATAHYAARQTKH